MLNYSRFLAFSLVLHFCVIRAKICVRVNEFKNSSKLRENSILYFEVNLYRFTSCMGIIFRFQLWKIYIHRQ